MMMQQCIKCYFSTGKQKTRLEGPNSPVRFLGWIPEENYMWHVTPFFFLVEYKAQNYDATKQREQITG